MKKLLPIIFLFAALYIGWNYFNLQNYSAGFIDQSDRALSIAFNERKSGIQVEGRGTVIRILPDDNRGSRHQRFILKLYSGPTLLIAHNIDLAPQIFVLREGDVIEFNGEYEWNSKGGVIHWTHHDPNGRHVGGWLKHKGRIYQ